MMFTLKQHVNQLKNPEDQAWKARVDTSLWSRKKSPVSWTFVKFETGSQPSPFQTNLTNFWAGTLSQTLSGLCESRAHVSALHTLITLFSLPPLICIFHSHPLMAPIQLDQSLPHLYLHATFKPCINTQWLSFAPRSLALNNLTLNFLWPFYRFCSLCSSALLLHWRGKFYLPQNRVKFSLFVMKHVTT